MKRTHEPDHLEPPKVLILCQDARTCYQLKQFLTQSGEQYLFYTAIRQDIPIVRLSKKFDLIGGANGERLRTQATATAVTPTPSSLSASLAKSKKTKKSTQVKTSNDSTTSGYFSSESFVTDETDELNAVLSSTDFMEEDGELLEEYQESYILTMTQTQFNDTLADSTQTTSTQDTSENSADIETCTQHDKSIFEPFPELENLDITAAVASHKQPLICVQTFKTEQEGPMALQRTLEEIHPQYIVMYNCNITAIRQLEIYEARLHRPKEERIKVFFLMHGKTVEEQSYLTSLRREKQAFELIIETKRVSGKVFLIYGHFFV